MSIGIEGGMGIGIGIEGYVDIGIAPERLRVASSACFMSPSLT